MMFPKGRKEKKYQRLLQPRQSPMGDPVKYVGSILAAKSIRCSGVVCQNLRGRGGKEGQHVAFVPSVTTKQDVAAGKTKSTAI